MAVSVKLFSPLNFNGNEKLIVVSRINLATPDQVFTQSSATIKSDVLLFLHTRLINKRQKGRLNPQVSSLGAQKQQKPSLAMEQ